MLPFFLSSVFFAIFSKNLEQQNHRNIAVHLSGILLGLSIFIKVSMVVMIPMVLYLVYYTSTSKSNAWIRLGMKNMVVLWFHSSNRYSIIVANSKYCRQSGRFMGYRCFASEHSSNGGNYCHISEFHYCRSSAHVTRVFGHSLQHIKEGIYHYALDFTIRVFFVNILYSVFSFDSCNTSLVHSRSFSY